MTRVLRRGFLSSVGLLTACMLCASESPPVDSTENRVKTWQGIEFYVDQIFEMPRWPVDGSMTSSEWAQYLRMAAILSELSECDLRQVATGFMIRDDLETSFQDEREEWKQRVGEQDQDGGEHIEAGQNWREERISSLGRLVILFRLIFKVPPDAQPYADFDAGLDFRACGGLPFAPIPGKEPELAHAPSSPIAWRSGRPELVAMPGPDPLGFRSGGFYQPLRELSYFEEHFPRRTAGALDAVADVVDADRVPQAR